MKHLRLVISIIFILLIITSCQRNPATGDNEINLLSEKEEDAIGQNEHEKIVKQFGGLYQNERLNNYIDSLGNFLVSTSELSDKKFKFTVLDTPIINAFALPGGYVYLTRGLIYLCQNEAQLAGVIAHEIGHITARHSARRYTKTLGTNVLLQIFNIFSKNNFVNNLAGQSAQLYLLSYSRSQEYQADKLAVRYMVRAGFDAKEMANFLRIMENFSNIQKKIYKIDNKVSELLLTHPNSSKRVQEVVESYKGKIQLNPIIGREVFLKKIDGLSYGHRSEEGFFLKDTFVHKRLKIKFSFDNNFYFLNNPNSLIGITEKNTKVIFDLDQTSKENNLEYINSWLNVSSKKVFDFNTISNNGFTIKLGKFLKKKKIFVFATLQDEENMIYRFLLATSEDELNYFYRKFEKIILSFSKISDEESNSLNPPVIKILSATSNTKFFEKVLENSSLQTMHSKEIFSTLNDLKNNKIDLDGKIKTVY